MPITIGDQDFDSEAILRVRQSVIEVRDAAIKESRFDYSVPLSYAVALLHHLSEGQKVEEADDLFESLDDGDVDLIDLDDGDIL